MDADRARSLSARLLIAAKFSNLTTLIKQDHVDMFLCHRQGLPNRSILPLATTTAVLRRTRTLCCFFDNHACSFGSKSLSTSSELLGEHEVAWRRREALSCWETMHEAGSGLELTSSCQTGLCGAQWWWWPLRRSLARRLSNVDELLHCQDLDPRFLRDDIESKFVRNDIESKCT